MGSTETRGRSANLPWRVVVGVGAIGAFTVAGCAAYDTEGSPNTTSEALSANGVSLVLSITNDWGGGYCATGTLTNQSSAAVSSWQVVLDTSGSSISQLWNGSYTTRGTNITVSPVSWNAAIPASGGSSSFGFCATGSGRPVGVSLTVGGGVPASSSSSNPSSGHSSSSSSSNPSSGHSSSSSSSSSSSGSVTTGNVYYVAPTGNDANPGTLARPFASWARAQAVVSPGDTVYFRGGTYKYTDATSTCASPTSTISDVMLNRSGTSAKRIHYWAYPGERPVFDFSGVTDTSKYSCRQVGVNVAADWLHLKGLEFKGVLQLNSVNHESWCVYLTGGSNNLFEQLDAHHNMGPGFFIQKGSNNTFLNCDSHENEDTLTSNGDGQSADGFGCHASRVGDTGNVFRGCRAWWNSDDGWDFINSQGVCTVEYSWAWYNGYKPDALSGGKPVSLAAGNGNGIKAGGYGDPQANVPSVPPQHIVRYNLAFYNKANGLYANHEIVSPFFYHNTTFNNGTDVNMLGLDGTTVTSVGVLRNNIAYSNNGRTLLAEMSNGGPISDANNSWDGNMGLTVTATDFQSVAFSPPASCPEAYRPGGTPCCAPSDMTCFAGLASARNPDGSLPVLPFLRLASTSKLINKGVNIGLPYNGSAPDLGAFESP